MENWTIKSIGAILSGTAGVSAKLDFTAGSNYSGNFVRQAVTIASCGASPVYVSIVPRGYAAPTVSSSSFDYCIPAGMSDILRVERSVDLYFFGTTAYTAKELG